MARIGTNLSNKRTKDGQMKEDSFVVRLQFILSRVLQGDIEAERHNVKILMEERGYENHPFFNMILGLISSQLWYSSLPEEIQWKDTFKIHSPTHSDESATASQLKMSATRFSHEVGDSERHNTVFNEESGASFHCDSETSVMKEKEISVEVDGSVNREALPVKVDKLHKENLQIDFQPRGFYVNSAETDASFDNNGGHMHFVPNLTAFENSGSWLLPLRTGNWDLDQIVRDEEYRNAVKYLQEAVHSTPPVPAALLPLVQLLLIGCKDKEALDEIENFCANSSGALPKRMKANLLERSDPKCSHSLARLIRLHQKGDYSPQSLLEMIALHLDAVFVKHDTWREFALCFLKVSRCEEDEMSVCLHGNEGEKRQSYSFCYNGIPKMFTHGKSVGLWRSRCRWWSTRHFSKSILASEIDAGDWQLLTYKAACASHMYGQDFGYFAKAYTCIQKENNRDLSMFLRQHRQNSIGFYSQHQRGNS
ncbi:TAF RNA polymerase I SUBUNIT A [Salix koriyanagi]|nr:TAF RNA polymerase I SUBUNIT A [Salix koriyanagi]